MLLKEKVLCVCVCVCVCVRASVRALLSESLCECCMLLKMPMICGTGAVSVLYIP